MGESPHGLELLGADEYFYLVEVQWGLRATDYSFQFIRDAVLKSFNA